MRETVSWYVQNRRWWERVLTEAYRAANAMYLEPGRARAADAVTQLRKA